MKKYSPIVLFLYNRLEESKKTINALSKSNGANNSDLLVYIDGPKNQKDVKIQDEINLFIDNLNGKFLTIKKIHNKNNLGLGKSIISGLNNTFKEYESAIILEDDIVVSNNFLNYCNLALKLYKNTNIFHISGWSPVCEKNMKPYLTNYMACWGWATWRSKWAEYQKDPEKIIHYFKKNPYQKFKFNFFNNLYGQVIANYENRIDTWAVFWAYTIFKQSGLCLNPPKSLIMNIGIDGNGTNYKNSNFSDRLLNWCFYDKPVKLSSYNYLKKINTKIRIFYFCKNILLKPFDILFRKL